jgi:dCMP deaminase
MNLNWNEYYMTQAVMVSLKSKDPSTKVGCVIVDQNNKQISIGYNGFPAGVDETKLNWNKDMTKGIENTKYPYVIHAEANAIINAKKDISGCSIYVTLFPCNECAKLLAASKIAKVYYLNEKPCKMSNKILQLANVELKKICLSSTKIKEIQKYLGDFLQ